MASKKESKTECEGIRLSLEEKTKVGKYSDTMGITKSQYERLWICFGNLICGLLERSGELPRFFDGRMPILSLKTTVYENFLYNEEMPEITKHFFEGLIKQVERTNNLKKINQEGGK